VPLAAPQKNCAYCLFGALDASTTYNYLLFKAKNACYRKYGIHLVTFNDSKKTKYEDVIRFLDGELARKTFREWVWAILKKLKLM
jgi:hypothetical protein